MAEQRDRELCRLIISVLSKATDAETCGERFEEAADLIAAHVAEEIKPYDLALQSLTPGGSEFVRNPERCAKFARERRDSANAAMKKAIIERNELRSENERLRQMLDGLADLSNARLVTITDENKNEFSSGWRHVGKECVVVTAYAETAVVEVAIGNDPLHEWLRERAAIAKAEGAK
jgi:hypothetical protein